MFNQLFLDGQANSSSLRKFWAHVKATGDPRLEGHKKDKRPDWNDHAAVAAIHGDAVPCLSIGKAGTTSYCVYSMKGILGSGTTLQQKQYLFGNFDDSEVENPVSNTMLQVWKVVLWSLTILIIIIIIPIIIIIIIE